VVTEDNCRSNDRKEKCFDTLGFGYFFPYNIGRIGHLISDNYKTKIIKFSKRLSKLEFNASQNLSEYCTERFKTKLFHYQHPKNFFDTRYAELVLFTTIHR